LFSITIRYIWLNAGSADLEGCGVGAIGGLAIEVGPGVAAGRVERCGVWLGVVPAVAVGGIDAPGEDEPIDKRPVGEARPRAVNEPAVDVEPDGPVEGDPDVDMTTSTPTMIAPASRSVGRKLLALTGAAWNDSSVQDVACRS
jgi:hypothetical protein